MLTQVLDCLSRPTKQLPAGNDTLATTLPLRTLKQGRATKRRAEVYGVTQHGEAARLGDCLDVGVLEKSGNTVRSLLNTGVHGGAVTQKGP